MVSNKLNKSMKVKAMLDEGKSVVEIAKAVSCNKALVYMVRKRFFPELGRKYKTRGGRDLKRKKLSPEAMAKIKEWSSKKVTLDEIRDTLPVKMRKAVAEIARKKLAELEAVNSPPHYTVGGIETYDFIKSKLLSYELGNVVKYVARAEWKANKLEDLKKAQWYLTAAIKKEEGA